VLTGDALNAIVQLVSKTVDLPAFDLQLCLWREKSDGLETLKVFRVLPNPSLLLATRPDEKMPVTVRVPNNENFRPGMALHARQISNGQAPAIYKLEGRCPRLPGQY
jgi:hypothetical protein